MKIFIYNSEIKPRPTKIYSYSLNRKTILKHYFTKALTLRYPPYTFTCQLIKGSLGWLYFFVHKFLKDELAIIESGYYM